jgi:hypothetical protein
MQADEMVAMASVDVALNWHLRSNHYPPLPVELIDPAKAAIEAGNDGDFDRLIQLPDVLSFRDGRTAIMAWEMIESLHLDSFIDYPGEDY